MNNNDMLIHGALIIRRFLCAISAPATHEGLIASLSVTPIQEWPGMRAIDQAAKEFGGYKALYPSSWAGVGDVLPLVNRIDTDAEIAAFGRMVYQLREFAAVHEACNHDSRLMRAQYRDRLLSSAPTTREAIAAYLLA